MATDFIGQGQSSVTSPAALSTADMLVQIDTAIKAILGGAQEYQIGTRRIRRSELSILMKERRLLQQQLSNEEGHGAAVAYLHGR